MRKINLLLTVLLSTLFLTGCINNQAVNTLNESAKVLLESGDVQGAICRLQSSLELDDSKYQTRYNLGVAYVQLGDFERAKENLERVIEMKEDYVDTYYTLGFAYENYAYGIINKVAQVALDNDMTGQGDEQEVLSDEEKESAVKNLNEAIKYYNTYVEKTTDEESKKEVLNQIANIKRTMDKYQVEVRESGN